MHWFKILLIVVLASSVLIRFYEAGKGEYEEKSKPSTKITAALLGILWVLGVVYYLD